MLELLGDRMREYSGRLAVARSSATATYEALHARMAEWRVWLAERVPPGDVVSMEADYDVDSVALFLALAANGNIIVPLSNDSRAHRDAFLAVAQVEHRVRPGLDGSDHAVTGRHADHPMYGALREREHP